MRRARRRVFSQLLRSAQRVFGAQGMVFELRDYDVEEVLRLNRFDFRNFDPVKTWAHLETEYRAAIPEIQVRHVEDSHERFEHHPDAFFSPEPVVENESSPEEPPYYAPLRSEDYATGLPLLQEYIRCDDGHAMSVYAGLLLVGRGVTADPTHAWTVTKKASTGQTDAFGREQSTALAVASSFGLKLGAYPGDVLMLNAQRAAQAKLMEIDRNMTQLKREYQRRGLTEDEFQAKMAAQMQKKQRVAEGLQGQMSGG